MGKSSQYVSHEPDADGFIHWSAEENRIWHDLITRQLDCVPGYACDEYMHGLDVLKLPMDRVPQLEEVSEVLRQHTGWSCASVPALINFDRFFQLLSDRQFPVATFIRTREEFDYLQEPDIFHEIFGHCPLLTNQAFADFTQMYGELGLHASKEDRVFLARLYWFTVEFGLLNTAKGLRIYGGGILSSPGETQYAIHDKHAIRQDMDVLEALRTPYRIDIMQPIYFCLTEVKDLYKIGQLDIMKLVDQAKKIGLKAPLFAPKAG